MLNAAQLELLRKVLRELGLAEHLLLLLSRGAAAAIGHGHTAIALLVQAAPSLADAVHVRHENLAPVDPEERGQVTDQAVDEGVQSVNVIQHDIWIHCERQKVVAQHKRKAGGKGGRRGRGAGRRWR